MKTESIIFDLDGTLWDSSDNVAAAWDEAIRNSGHPLLRNMKLTGADIRGVMGLTMEDIAEKLFPMLSRTMQTEVLEKCMENENVYLSLHGGRLFDGVEKTLEALSRSHRLFIVSNCQCGYIESFFESCGMEKYFTDYLCWGDTGKPKSDTIRILMESNGVTSAVYMGDTQGDLEASKTAGIPFIHAAYGFGTITSPEKVDAAAYKIADLIEIIE